MSAQPIVLSIAGFDPCSGAGVTADIKTISAHGCYAVSCITALTVQSTMGVTRTHSTPAKLVAETLRVLAADFEIAATRIGMLGSADVVDAVADFLNATGARNVVLDPIIRSSSGAELLDKKGAEHLRKRLLPMATIVTPNVSEAAVLTGLPVHTVAEMKAAAIKLHQMGALHVVVTGGDRNGGPTEKAVDVLSSISSSGPPQQEEFASDRVRTNSTHGTGCAFASALAANLALGKQLPDAVVLAKAYVKTAIASAHPLGKGNGPLNHLYRLEESPRAMHEPAVAGKEH
jgi:hydroxymethylpyrimidine/phosphomethylpyrimidine kinase